MNEATKDFILLCIVGYVIWVLLAMLWFRFVNWWKKRFSNTHKKYYAKKYPHKTLTSDDILGKSRYNIQEERAKQQAREQQYQRQEEERQERAKKEEMRIQALALEMAKEMVKEEMRLQQPPPSDEPPERYPRVVPVEELDAVFSNEEVLPDYSMPDKSDKMMATDSATTIDELKNVVTVLKHKEVTTVEQQQEAVRVIAKIDNTLLLEQMLSQIDGATKYASELIEKHYTEQLTPHPKPQIEGFDMGKYLNY